MKLNVKICPINGINSLVSTLSVYLLKLVVSNKENKITRNSYYFIS